MSSSDTPSRTLFGNSLLPRRLLLALGAATPAAATMLVAAPVHADPSVSDGRTRIRTVDLNAAGAVDTDDGPAREVSGVAATMVGVTWTDAVTEPVVEVRGLQEDGTWSPWYDLEVALDPEDGTPAQGTEAAWLGPVTAVQARGEVDGADVTDELTVHLVTTSPTASDTDPVSGAQAMATTSATTQATPTLGVGAPSYVSRAGWGADESLTGSTSASTSLKAVAIHHTAGSNSYSSSSSAQIVRGILSYHTQTLGWADIGYNVLVDKYGTVFEGRKGGLHRNIIGAHALGFNTGSWGISVMGDYSTSAPPRAARDAVSRLVAWKLLSTFRDRVWGTDSWTPTTSGTRFAVGTPVTLARVFGHRDVNYTSCPGNAFFAQFDAIRSSAQNYVDSGDRAHLNAFKRAGGESKLGTVTHGAHRAGAFTVTRLTKGLVLQQGTGTATAYATPFSSDWGASWGRALGRPFTVDGVVRQAFSGGIAVRRGSRTTFSAGGSRFVDVPDPLQFSNAINTIAAKGITTGWPDKTYRPYLPVQRDAMVTFVYRAMGSPAYTPPATSPFGDMTPRTKFYKEICWANARGIVTGWPDGTFKPTAPINRDAVAAFLYRASGSPWVRPRVIFSDVAASNMYLKEITWLADNGITTGWPDGTFRPLQPVQRDAMAAFMIRWMNLRGL